MPTNVQASIATNGPIFAWADGSFTAKSSAAESAPYQ